MDEAIVASRADGLLVEAHRVAVAALETSNLGTHERGAVFEIVGARLGSELEVPIVNGYCPNVILSRISSHEIADGCFSQSGVEVIFVLFKKGSGDPEQPLCPRCGFHACHIITCEEPRLQFSNPVPELAQSEILYFQKAGSRSESHRTDRG